MYTAKFMAQARVCIYMVILSNIYHFINSLRQQFHDPSPDGCMEKEVAYLVQEHSDRDMNTGRARRRRW
jgi:hypothetical protein